MSTAPLTAADAQVQVPAPTQSTVVVQATLAAERSSAQEGPAWEEIAAEAYALYVADGYREGNDLQHWLEAERTVQQRRAQRDAIP